MVDYALPPWVNFDPAARINQAIQSSRRSRDEEQKQGFNQDIQTEEMGIREQEDERAKEQHEAVARAMALKTAADKQFQQDFQALDPEDPKYNEKVQRLIIGHGTATADFRGVGSAINALRQPRATSPATIPTGPAVKAPADPLESYKIKVPNDGSAPWEPAPWKPVEGPRTPESMAAQSSEYRKLLTLPAARPAAHVPTMADLKGDKGYETLLKEQEDAFKNYVLQATPESARIANAARYATEAYVRERGIGAPESQATPAAPPETGGNDVPRGTMPRAATPASNPSNEVIRFTADGKQAVFDKETKKFLRYGP